MQTKKNSPVKGNIKKIRLSFPEQSRPNATQSFIVNKVRLFNLHFKIKTIHLSRMFLWLFCLYDLHTVTRHQTNFKKKKKNSDSDHG